MNFSKIDFIKLVRSFDSTISLTFAKALADSYETWAGSISADNINDFYRIANVVGKLSRREIVILEGSFYPSMPSPMSNKDLWGQP